MRPPASHKPLPPRADAGGRNNSQVCYHTNDASRDYGPLGHAEAVRVTLDAANATAQLDALARDFFASFSGPVGHRRRPDPGDRGTPYRSFVGLPGGVDSPLYVTLARRNTWRMDLKRGVGGPAVSGVRAGDADEPNTVWIIDSNRFPFYPGEVYHQFHCNFFPSEGMPYPSTYVIDLWHDLQRTGQLQRTGCPEGSHSPCSSAWFG